MAKPNSLVDGVKSLSTPARTLMEAADKPPESMVTVSFKGGRTGLLDMRRSESTVWAGVLESVQDDDEQAYVEVDPHSDVITELLLPIDDNVESITPSGDDVEVALRLSHAVHVLKRSNPDFQEILDALESAKKDNARILLTETMRDCQIIDVRRAPNPPAVAALAEPLEEVPPTERAEKAVTQDQAEQIFNLVHGKNCVPQTPAPPCIPFMYPRDGCWARAHEMCRLIALDGFEARKVWIYGSLEVATPNALDCKVNWRYHVAPTILVDTGSMSQVQVIDPSMFNAPVPQATWVNAQGDSSAVTADTDASVYYRSPAGGLSHDNDYSDTKIQLKRYRRQLQLASVPEPPPYSHCL
jgi:hypothetical protein